MSIIIIVLDTIDVPDKEQPNEHVEYQSQDRISLSSVFNNEPTYHTVYQSSRYVTDVTLKWPDRHACHGETKISTH